MSGKGTLLPASQGIKGGPMRLSPLDIHQGRRAFLKSAGALVVTFAWAAPATLAQQAQAPRLPGSLNNNRMLDGWLRINANGTVTVFTGKVELGQGILTALAQIASDELDVAYERVEMVSADTSRSLLLAVAAKKLGVAPGELTVADGMVSAGNARLSYGELAGEAGLKREATARVQPKPPSAHRMIGKSVPRRDIPGKVTGKPSFV